jgi:hypothetical protein
MSQKTYQGSCHCQRVRYRVELDLESESSRCNCSLCSKQRRWSMIVKPAAFQLLAGESELSDYQFGTKSGHHLFCRHCGLHAFGRGYVKEIGGDYVSINVACLDNVEPSDLVNIPVRFMDGRNNNWFAAPTETRQL